jgi:hypothetical protein
MRGTTGIRNIDPGMKTVRLMKKICLKKTKKSLKCTQESFRKRCLSQVHTRSTSHGNMKAGTMRTETVTTRAEAGTTVEEAVTMMTNEAGTMMKKVAGTTRAEAGTTKAEAVTTKAEAGTTRAEVTAITEEST